MTAKKAAKSPKHKTAAKKHAASAKHTETKAQLAHLHVLHVEHEAHLAHMAATGQKVTVKAKPAAHAKAAKKVAFAVGDRLPVCGFEAVAMSLRLAGQRVHDDDMAGLWELCGSPAEGVPVGEALAAAARFGLAGCRPVNGGNRVRLVEPDQMGRLKAVGRRQGLPEAFPRIGVHHLEVALDEGVQQVFGHGLILRIDVPGPHAVLATPDGWWSWGELYSPWPCTVSEAWAVSWS